MSIFFLHFSLFSFNFKIITPKHMSVSWFSFLLDLYEEIMSLVCNCNCHVFRFTKLRRQKVISIKKNKVFTQCFNFVIIDIKKKYCTKKMSRLIWENNAKNRNGISLDIGIYRAAFCRCCADLLIKGQIVYYNNWCLYTTETIIMTCFKL